MDNFVLRTHLSILTGSTLAPSQGRTHSQSCCPSNTDRGATTENPDPEGRSVGALAAQAALVARRRRRFSIGNGHFERKSVKKSPAARIMVMSDDRVFAASFRDEVAADP